MNRQRINPFDQGTRRADPEALALLPAYARAAATLLAEIERQLALGAPASCSEAVGQHKSTPQPKPEA